MIQVFLLLFLFVPVQEKDDPTFRMTAIFEGI
jgi:hypothetical protein